MVAPVSAPGPVAGLPALFHPNPVRPTRGAERLAAADPDRDPSGAAQRASPRFDARAQEARFDAAGRRPRPDDLGPRSARAEAFDSPDQPGFASRPFGTDPFGSGSREGGAAGRYRPRPSTTFLAQAIGQELDAESGIPGGGRDPRSVAGLYSRTNDAVERSRFRGLTPPGFGDAAP